MGRTRKIEPINKDYENFGNKIRELRLSRNLTQAELSRLIGISKSSVVNYETGTRKIPLTLIRKFADFFNVSLDDLLGITEELESTVLETENHKDVYKNFGLKIKQLRRENNITQTELAKALGITQSTVVAIEKGLRKIPIDLLTAFSDFFKIPVDDLIGATSKEESTPEYEVLAKNLKDFRSKRNLSREELALDLGIKPELLASYESGIKKISLTDLIKLSRYFNVSIEGLVGFELGENNDLAVVTSSRILESGFKRWETEIGYNTLTREEIDEVIDYAKYLLYKRTLKEE